MKEAGMEDERPNKGVLLLNYGGPRSEEEILPFLEELFSDPFIFKFPGIIRRPFSRFLARRRAPKLASIYGSMGRFSPIWEETARQAEALREALGPAYKVFTGMRYFPSELDRTAEEIRDSGIGELLLLPLYPQESETTTGSALAAARSSLRKAGFKGSVTEARNFFREEGFVGTLCEMLERKLSEAGENRPKVIFAAHGLPAKLAIKDNYLDQVKETAKTIGNRLSLVVSLTNASANSWQEAILAFQSKVGPAKWLRPSVEEVIEEWGEAGCKSVLVVPISFVSEHSETLYEIDIVYREMAKEREMRFDRLPTVGCDARFIGALAAVARRKLNG